MGIERTFRTFFYMTEFFSSLIWSERFLWGFTCLDSIFRANSVPIYFVYKSNYVFWWCLYMCLVGFFFCFCFIVSVLVLCTIYFFFSLFLFQKHPVPPSVKGKLWSLYLLNAIWSMMKKKPFFYIFFFFYCYVLTF